MKNTNSWKVNIYLWELVKGLGVTIRHMINNLTGRTKRATIRYPEEKRPIPLRTRGLHRLLKRPDGGPRCVACMMCATACPAECIYIEANEVEPHIEKAPQRFDIDLLRCVFCGYCAEACPCDAIRMDTGVYSLTGYDRKDMVITMDKLLQGKGMEGSRPDDLPPKTLPGVHGHGPDDHKH